MSLSHSNLSAIESPDDINRESDKRCSMSIPNEDPADCSSAAPHMILSRMRCSEWAVVSRSLSHADGPLLAILLKTFRCDDACLRRLLSIYDGGPEWIPGVLGAEAIGMGGCA